MAIEKYTRDFKGIWIPKEIWLNEEMTLMEKIFLVEIDSLDNEDGCYASNKHFSEFFQISKGRCTQIIKALEAKKYIKIDYERSGKQVTRRIIKVVRKLNTPIKYSKHPYLENAEENNTSLNNTFNKDIVGQAQTMPIKEIVDYLNERTGSSYRPTTPSTKKLIQARIKEGFTEEDFYKVIDTKTSEWLKDSQMKKYLRPQTLFGTKFEAYLNEQKVEEARLTPSQIKDEEIRRRTVSRWQS